MTLVIWLLLVQSSVQKPDPLVGDWTGTSICTVRPSACHDETALYRISAQSGKDKPYHLEGDKIVDGKPVYMGESDCSFNPAKHDLHCQLGRGVVHLHHEGDRLSGRMDGADGKIWRKIELKKASAPIGPAERP